MRLGNWLIGAFAGGAALYAIRDFLLFRDRDDDVGRSHRRSSIGLLFLLLIIPLGDLSNHVDMSTGVRWLIAGFGICLGSVGYHWLTARRTWTHGLTRSFLVGCFILGWIVALIVPVAGDYELTHRLPTASTVGTYLIIAMVIAPFIAVFFAFVLGRLG